MAGANQGRQGVWQEVASGHPSIVGLNAPDRRDHMTVDAELPLGRAQ